MLVQKPLSRIRDQNKSSVIFYMALTTQTITNITAKLHQQPRQQLETEEMYTQCSDI